MANKVIGVADNLGNVRQALEAAGFKTVSLEDSAAQQATALVTGGVDENFLGINATSTQVPVFSAQGKSAEELVREIKGLQLQ